MARRSKSSASTAVATDRQLQALQLRQDGYTYQQIGDELGITKEAAWMLVDKALKNYREAVKESTRELVEITLAQLDGLLHTYIPLTKTGDDKAAGVVLKTISEKAKLVGMYAPSKTELTGKDGGPVASTTVSATVDYSSLSTEELAVLADLLRKSTPKSDAG